MIAFRNAEPDDLSSVVAIYNSTIASGMVTADTEPVTVEDKLHWFNQHDDHARPLWIVEQSGTITGWVSFQSFYNRPAYRYTAEISIYLHADFRGKGLGKQILSYCFSKCPVLEIKTLLGFIFAHNIPSIRLFEKEGFQDWGTLPNIATLYGVERTLKIFGKRVH